MNLPFLLRETKLGISNNIKMGIMSVLISGFSLFFLSFFLLLTWNAYDLIKIGKERLEMDVFLKEGTSPELRDAFIDILTNFALVEKIHLASPSEEEKIFTKNFPEYSSLLSLFDTNIFPEKIVIKLKNYALSPIFIKHLKKKISAFPLVDDVHFGESWLINLYKILIFLISLDVTLVFLFTILVSVVMIQTLKLTIERRSQVLFLMELVGTSEGTLRSPFLLEGWLYGIVGAFLSGGVLLLFSRVISLIFGINFAHSLPIVALFLILGSILGYFSSLTAISSRKRYS